MVSDTISFGQFSLQNHIFGVADIETDHFANNATLFDGLFGTAQSVSPSRGAYQNDEL